MTNNSYGSKNKGMKVPSMQGENHPRWNPNKTLFKAYASKVRKITEENYKNNKDIINPVSYTHLDVYKRQILKLLIEQNQLIIHDQNTISELNTFSKKGISYEAEPGKHDDLVIGLVLFGWLSEQQYFKDITNINTLLSLSLIHI